MKLFCRKIINILILPLILNLVFILLFELPAYTDASEFFKEILKANSRIHTIDSDIVQYITTSRHSTEIFKGRYRADIKGRLRIDYNVPDKQIVLNNGRILLWYYPDDGILYQIGSNENPASGPSISPLKEYMYREFEKMYSVTYLGKHLYGFFNTAHQFVVKNIKDGSSTDIWIDSKNNIILAKIVRDENNIEIIKEIYGSHRIINDICFPTRMDVFTRTSEGNVQSTTEYSNVRLNYDIKDNVFEIKFPKDIIRKYLNAK